MIINNNAVCAEAVKQINVLLPQMLPTQPFISAAVAFDVKQREAHEIAMNFVFAGLLGVVNEASSIGVELTVATIRKGWEPYLDWLKSSD